jgi:hypothetical protein
MMRPGRLRLVRPDPYRRRRKEGVTMTVTPFGGLIGSGISTLATPLGPTATAMGGLVFGLLVLTAAVIVIGGRRSAS